MVADTVDRSSRRWSSGQVAAASEAHVEAVQEAPKERAQRELREQRLKTMTCSTVVMGIAEGASSTCAALASTAHRVH